MVKLYQVRAVKNERTIAFPHGKPSHYERFVEPDGVVWYRPVGSQAPKPPKRPVVPKPEPLPAGELTPLQRGTIFVIMTSWLFHSPAKKFHMNHLPEDWKHHRFSWDQIQKEADVYIAKGTFLQDKDGWITLNPTQ